MVAVGLASLSDTANADLCQSFNDAQKTWAEKAAATLRASKEVLLYCSTCPSPSGPSPYAAAGEKPKRLRVRSAQAVHDGTMWRVAVEDADGHTIDDLDVAYAFALDASTKTYENVGASAGCTFATSGGVPAQIDAEGHVLAAPRPAPVDRRCRPGERVVFDIHGPGVTCEEWLAVLRAAPNGKGGTDAPVVEAARALTRIAVSPCVPDTRSGRNRVRVTFGPKGRVIAARLDRGPLVGTDSGRCIERLYAGIVVSSYRGGPFTLAAEPWR